MGETQGRMFSVKKLRWAARLLPGLVIAAIAWWGWGHAGMGQPADVATSAPGRVEGAQRCPLARHLCDGNHSRIAGRCRYPCSGRPASGPGRMHQYRARARGAQIGSRGGRSGFYANPARTAGRGNLHRHCQRQSCGREVAGGRQGVAANPTVARGLHRDASPDRPGRAGCANCRRPARRSTRQACPAQGRFPGRRHHRSRARGAMPPRGAWKKPLCASATARWMPRSAASS